MYSISIQDIDRCQQAIEWCDQSIEDGWTLQANWPAKGYIFNFKHQKDAVWFSLTWS